MVEKEIPTNFPPKHSSHSAPSQLTEEELHLPLGQYLARVSGELRRRDLEKGDDAMGLHRIAELKAKREKKDSKPKRRSGHQRRHGIGLSRNFLGQRSPF